MQPAALWGGGQPLQFDAKSLALGRLLDDGGQETRSDYIRTSSADQEACVEPHPSQSSALPTPCDFEDSPFSPLIVTADPRVASQVVGADERGHLPLNELFPVQTETFAGRMIVYFRGSPGTPKAVFRDNKQLGKCIIQGKFRKPTPVGDVWMGQELLNKPLLPVSFQRVVFTAAAKMFSSTHRVSVEGEGDSIGFLNPLLAVAQVCNISPPGCEPEPEHAEEDMRLLDPSLVDKHGKPLSGPQRQRHFDRLANLDAGLVFDTHNVYTFVVCQSMMNVPAYRLSLGGFLNLDLCPLLNGQPMQMMCKNARNHQVLVSLLLWHKQLNWPERRGGRKTLSDSSSCASSYRHSRVSSSDLSALDVGSSHGGCSTASVDGSSSCGCSAHGEQDDEEGSEYASCSSEMVQELDLDFDDAELALPAAAAAAPFAASPFAAAAPAPGGLAKARRVASASAALQLRVRGDATAVVHSDAGEAKRGSKKGKAAVAKVAGRLRGLFRRASC